MQCGEKKTDRSACFDKGCPFSSRSAMYRLNKSFEAESFLSARVIFPSPSFSLCAMIPNAKSSMILEAAAIFFDFPVRRSVNFHAGLPRRGQYSSNGERGRDPTW